MTTAFRAVLVGSGLLRLGDRQLVERAVAAPPLVDDRCPRREVVLLVDFGDLVERVDAHLVVHRRLHVGCAKIWIVIVAWSSDVARRSRTRSRCPAGRPAEQSTTPPGLRAARTRGRPTADRRDGVGRQRVADQDVRSHPACPRLSTSDRVGLRAARRDGSNPGRGPGVNCCPVVLAIVRSMPVATWSSAYVLLVSSASKIALFGSTVTVLVIGPTPGGATSDERDGLVECRPTSAGAGDHVGRRASPRRRTPPGSCSDRRSGPPAADRAPPRRWPC